MSGKTSQVFGVILFIAVGVSAIFLGIKQYTQKINGPFAVNAAVAGLANQLNGNSAAVDKTKDTDGDGLSDYDEINIYHTSPYLADTDSDGIPDGTEVKNGTDPNCPQGKTCVSPTPSNNQIPSDSELDLNALTNEQNAINADQTNLNDLLNSTSPTTNNQQPTTNVQPTAADVRAMLINSGLDEQSLQGISDADLLELYNESLAETAAEQANANSNANGNKNTP
jgi:hypothetical protein